MVLSNLLIKKLANEKNLISPFKEENLRNSSYDLTVGREYFPGKSSNQSTLITNILRPGESFAIPAYGLAYILCSEVIELPNDLTARVSLRMSLIYKGLVLTVQPPFDPNYKGKAIIFLHNMSTSPVYLKRGERIATIEFFSIQEPDNGIVQQDSVTTLNENIKYEVTSGLTELILKDKKNTSKNNLLLTTSITILTLILTAIAMLLNFVFTTADKSFDYYKKEIDAKYQNDISELNTKIQFLESELKTLKQSNKSINTNKTEME